MNRGSAAPSGVDEQVGEAVHLAMWRAGVTQSQLAKAIHVDQGSVSKRLRGLTPWKVTEVITAAQLCGVNFEDLLPPTRELGHAPAVARGDDQPRLDELRHGRRVAALERAAQAWGDAARIWAVAS